LREKGSTGQAESRKVLAEMRREMASVEEELSMSERGVAKLKPLEITLCRIPPFLKAAA